MVFLAALSIQWPVIAAGQRAEAKHSAASTLEQHYEAAFRFQNAGNTAQADSEYKLFLAMILHRFANGNANLGDYADAAPLFEEAHRLAPEDQNLQIDYAGAALDAGDWRITKQLATSALESLKSNGQPPNLHAVSMLADALLGLGEHQQALEQFKAASQLHPGIKTSSALATAYLLLGDKASAVRVIDEMSAGAPDTAAFHLQIGVLYGKTKFFDEAIEEFSKAIAMDARLRGAHYSLGASYMMHIVSPPTTRPKWTFVRRLRSIPTVPLPILRSRASR